MRTYFTQPEQTTHLRFKLESFIGVLLLFTAAALLLTGCDEEGAREGAAASPSAWIVEGREGRAEIIVAEDAPRTVKLAAEELQEYIGRISGATLPIVHSPSSSDRVRIYVGPSAYTAELGLSNEGLRYGAFQISSGSNWLAFIGGDRDFEPVGPWPRGPGNTEQDDFIAEWDAITGEHFSTPIRAMARKVDQTNSGTGLWENDLDNAGTFFAVNAFLRQLGVRWYMPGDIGEVVPDLPTIALPVLNTTATPDFALRNLYVFGGNFFRGRTDRMLWLLRMGANQGHEILSFMTNVGVAHGSANVIRRDETKAAHPEYYALRGGKPITGGLYKEEGPGVPSLVSDELVAANVRYLQALFDTHDLAAASVGPTDGFTFLCERPEAQALGTPERGFRGQMSDYTWQYIQRVAEGIAESHPDKYIHALAYSTYQMPPLKINHLPDNVIVGIAQSRVNFDNTQLRDSIRDLRQQWLDRITSGVPLWQYEYYLQGWRANQYRGIPAYYPQLIVEDLRSLRGISMGDYIEIFPSPPNYLNTYVTAQFLWDVDQDLDAMMEEFYRLFYGPAEKKMKAFIEYSEANWRTIPSSSESIDDIFERIHRAREVAGDSIYGERIDLLIEYMQPLREHQKKLGESRENIRRITAGTGVGKYTIDGQLDEPFWDELPLYSFTSADPARDDQGSVATTVRIGWHNDALFLGIRCDEPLMDQVHIGHTVDGDLSWFHYDGVEIMIETPQVSHYQIGVSPVGAITDMSRMGGFQPEWSSEVEVAAHIGDDFYSIEIRIPAAGDNQFELEPLNGVAGSRPTADKPWFINIGRLRLVAGDRETLSLSGFGFHDKMKFLELVVE